MSASTDRESFSDFYSATYRRVLAYAYSCAGDVTEAHDLTQEAYARLWPRWARIRRYEEPVAWLIRVVHNLSTSRWRRAATAARGLVRLRTEASRAAVPEPSPESMVLVAAMRRLPDAQRRALALHYLGDQSVAQIAATESVAEGTVKARLSRGRTALAQLLRDPVPTQGASHG